MHHRDLVLHTNNYKNTIKWLLEKKCLKDEVYCSKCVGKRMNLNINKNYARFICGSCSKTSSVFKNTIFYDCKKNIIELLDIIFFWSIDCNQITSAFQSNTRSNQTMNKWFEKLRKISCIIMKNENSSGKIGGFGHIVQIDESKFSKRKYEIGRVVKSPWIVGGIDCTTHQVFFVETFYRNASTLENIICDHVKVGSTIFTDCWAGYSNLNSRGFFHNTVNHSTNFVDPETGVNTQLIERTWGIYKKKMKSRGINYKSKIEEYFLEFYFKLKYGKETFKKIMENIYLVN